MAQVTKLERLLTQSSGLLGPVKGLTRVNIIANSSQSNEVLKQKEYTPISTLLHPPPARGKYFLIL